MQHCFPCIIWGKVLDRRQSMFIIYVNATIIQLKPRDNRITNDKFHSARKWQTRRALQ